MPHDGAGGAERSRTRFAGTRGHDQFTKRECRGPHLGLIAGNVFSDTDSDRFGGARVLTRRNYECP